MLFADSLTKKFSRDTIILSYKNKTGVPSSSRELAACVSGVAAPQAHAPLRKVPGSRVWAALQAAAGRAQESLPSGLLGKLLPGRPWLAFQQGTPPAAPPRGPLSKRTNTEAPRCFYARVQCPDMGLSGKERRGSSHANSPRFPGQVSGWPFRDCDTAFRGAARMNAQMNAQGTRRDAVRPVRREETQTWA